MSFNGADIMALSSMLDESKLAESGPSRQSQQPPMSLAPSKVVIGASNSLACGASSSSSSKSLKEKANAKDIWNDDEIPTEDSILSKIDGRPSPRYEFSYKQEIGTQDTFLGLNGKTPGSSDCSHLVVKIYFPGSKMADLDLDVTRDRIKAESSKFKLFTYLPTAVKHKDGAASFDSKAEVLTVTLPIINELFD